MGESKENVSFDWMEKPAAKVISSKGAAPKLSFHPARTHKKKMNLFVNNSKGFGIPSALMLSALIIFLMVAMLNLIRAQQREIRFVKEQVEIFSLKYQIMQIFTNPKSCKCQMNGLSIKGKDKITIYGLRDGCHGPNLLMKDRSVGRRHIKIDSLQVTDINRLSPTSPIYKGKLRVAYKREGLVRALKPIEIDMQFYTDPTIPSLSGAISDCVGYHELHTSQLDLINKNVEDKIGTHDQRVTINGDHIHDRLEPWIRRLQQIIN